MKKAIIGLSGLIVLTFFIIFAVANNNDKKAKKADTEVSKDLSQCPSIAACPGYAGLKMANCSPADCRKGGKCDPATCKGKCDQVNCKGSKCDPSACKGRCDPSACKTLCSGAVAEFKGGPINCNR